MNTGMKEYKNKLSHNSTILQFTIRKTNPFWLEAGSWPLEAIFAKRTHFAPDSLLWSLVFFAKRTHFPHFFANFENHNSTFNIYHSTFRRTAATKRTHFQSSRSIPASDKSLCRLSAFHIILKSLGSWVLKFLVFTKRTHFKHRPKIPSVQS
jgi:hypothetical protein